MEQNPYHHILWARLEHYIHDVTLDGKTYHCVVNHRITDGSTISDPMYENYSYHGIALINTGESCASYEVDRTDTRRPYVATPNSKRVSSFGAIPTDAPIALDTMAIHARLDETVSLFEVVSCREEAGEDREKILARAALMGIPILASEHQAWVYLLTMNAQKDQLREMLTHMVYAFTVNGTFHEQEGQI